MKFILLTLWILVFSIKSSAQSDIKAPYYTDFFLLSSNDIVGALEAPIYLYKSDSLKNEFRLVVTEEGGRVYHFIDVVTDRWDYFFAFKSDTIYIERISDNNLRIKNLIKEEISLIEELKTNNINLILTVDSIGSTSGSFLKESYLKSIKIYDKRNNIIRKYKPSVRESYFNLMVQLSDIIRLRSILGPFDICRTPPEFKTNEFKKIYFKEIENFIEKLNATDTRYIPILSLWLKPIMHLYSEYIAYKTDEADIFECKFNAYLDFIGDMRDIYLTQLMLREGQNETIRDKYLKKYLYICTNDFLKNKVLESSNLKEKINSNDTLSLSTLKSLSGESILWKELIQNNIGKVIYFDFWASWCAACKNNITDILSIREKYQDVSIILVSKDKSRDLWHKSIDSWNISNLGEHFWVAPESDLAILLTGNGIPRGLVVDKKGKIITIDAPAPGTKELDELLESLM